MLRDTGEGGKFSGVFCFVLKENMAWKILKTLKCEKKNGLKVYGGVLFSLFIL
jgi:hypothetical protein